WKTQVGDTVEIGQELGTLFTAEEPSVVVATRRDDRGRGATGAALRESGSPTPTAAIEPALSPTITRRLSQVIPANLQIDARWDTIQEAREAAKKKDPKHAPSPSVMIAWCVVRAMEKHAPFR